MSSSSGVDTDTDVSIMSVTSIDLSSWSEDTVTSLVNNGAQVIAVMSGSGSFDRDNQMFHIEGRRSADQAIIQSSTTSSLSDTFILSTVCQPFDDMHSPPDGNYKGSFTRGGKQVPDFAKLYIEPRGDNGLAITGEGESGVGRYKVLGVMTRRGKLAMIYYSDNYSNMSRSQRELALQLNQDPSQLSQYEQSELVCIVNGMLNPSDEINDWLDASGDDIVQSEEPKFADIESESANEVNDTLRPSDDDKLAPSLLVDSPATNSLGNYESSDEDDGYDTDDLCQSSTGSDDSDDLSDESSSSGVVAQRSRVYASVPLLTMASESVDPQAGMRVAMRFNNGNHYPGTIINVHPVHPIQPDVGLTVSIWLDDNTMETYVEYPNVDIRFFRNSNLTIAFDRTLFPGY